jgi:UDP-N-acetylglucosamine 1-carboxyvinyltransferase
MAELVIRGGRRLSGQVAVGGNKNAALPLLAACLLTSETCEIRNVPAIRDVAVMVDLLKSLGAEVAGEGTGT